MIGPLYAGNSYWIEVIPIGSDVTLARGLVGQLGFQITQVVGPLDANGVPYTTDANGTRTLTCIATWRGTNGAGYQDTVMWTCSQFPNSWPCGLQFLAAQLLSMAPPPAPPPVASGPPPAPPPTRPPSWKLLRYEPSRHVAPLVGVGDNMTGLGSWPAPHCPSGQVDPSTGQCVPVSGGGEHYGGAGGSVTKPGHFHALEGAFMNSLSAVPPRVGSTNFPIPAPLGPPVQAGGDPTTGTPPPKGTHVLPPLPPTPVATTVPASSNTMYWVLGIGAVAAAGLAIYVSSRPKKNPHRMYR